jgi:hypothetical protein
MPDPNVRYPLVAIPKCVFDAIAQDVAEDHNNPYAIVSVNEYIQTFLNHAPMYDYLLAFQRGDEIHMVGGIESTWTELQLQKVRVTKAQFELLRHRQEQYARDGFRVPLSIIVTSMLYQYSKAVRKALERLTDERWQLIACVFSDGKVEPIRRSFFQKDSDGWNSYSYKSEAERTGPSVIVGWHPRTRSLSGVNFDEF